MKKDLYSEMSIELSTMTALRRFLKTKNFEFINDLYDKIGAILDEKRADYELEQKEIIERQAKIEEAKKMLAEMNLSPQDLISEPTQKEIKPKKPAKYEFTLENGKKRRWHGEGKVPAQLQKLLDTGRQLDEFLIRSPGDQNSHNS